MSLTRQQRRAEERLRLKAARRERQDARTASTAAPAPAGGPRTPEGKATSSRNAMSHGLTAAATVLPWEDGAAFDRLLAQLIAEHNPQTPTESMYVREMAEQWWRLQRARTQEYELLCGLSDTERFSQPDQIEKLEKHLRLFRRYATTHERAFHRCVQVLRSLQKERAQREAELLTVSPSKVRKFVSQNPATAAPESAHTLETGLSLPFVPSDEVPDYPIGQVK